VELAHALHARGFQIAAHDPALKTLPAELDFIRLHADAASLVRAAAALVVCTEWPEFLQRTDWLALTATMRTPVVIDATRFLAPQLAGQPGLTYLTVGSPA